MPSMAKVDLLAVCTTWPTVPSICTHDTYVSADTKFRNPGKQAIEFVMKQSDDDDNLPRTENPRSSRLSPPHPNTWWRHQMETLSALLALCARISPVTGEFPSQRPVTRSFDVFLDLGLNKRLRKQSICRWFETPSFPLWRAMSCSDSLRPSDDTCLQGHGQTMAQVMACCWSHDSILTYDKGHAGAIVWREFRRKYSRYQWIYYRYRNGYWPPIQFG